MTARSPESTSVPGGRTLEELLGSGTSLEPAEVARIGVELGRALESAHAAGRRPYGVTARQVVLAADGHLVLSSPGGDPQPAGNGESGFADTPLYAAPEILQGEHGTQRSDVYSAGVVLYRLLTGAFPVPAQAVQQRRHIEARNARDDLRGSRVPLPLARVVERAIDARPEARYATLDALCADLQEAARELHARNGPVRRGLQRAAALLILIAIAGLVWVLAHSPLDRPIVAVRFRHHGGSIEAGEVVDGMTIEMSRLLAQAEGLEVRAALPSSSDRDTPGDDVAFGWERRASFVMSGWVHGEIGVWRLVETSLVSVRDGKVVWSDSFSFVDGDSLPCRSRSPRPS